ncbi:MAG TPA: response regulator [Syntrophobacteraceae bacterium]|nr:response regulator [Syntrophobacteraceae bacterium]
MEKKKPVVLVAEDNLVNQQLAKRMLEVLGCEVDLAANGIEALNAFETGSYDLVLMDCQMPEMDGLQASMAIREREKASDSRYPEGALVSRAVPIIAVTGQVSDHDRDSCIAAGMNDFLSKPFRLHEVEAMLKKWLHDRRKHD